MNSAIVADNQDATALQYNNLRKDVVQLAGDYASTTGTVNVYVLAVDAQIVSAYVEGTVFKFKANFTNTDSATLNVNTLGAKTIKKNGSQNLAPGDIKNGQTVTVIYDGIYMQMVTIGNRYPVENMMAGEAINGATLPVPVYQNITDNELYACDGNDTTKLAFIGFAVSNSTDGNPIGFQGNGIVSGFSGLDEGQLYYVQDAVGTIGTSIGTYPILVGRAITATEILILKSDPSYFAMKAIASNNLRISADAVNGFSTEVVYTLEKSILVPYGGLYRVKFDLASNDGPAWVMYAKIYKNGVAFGTEQSTDSATPVTMSEDLYFSAGDRIELWAKASTHNGTTRNFRIYYDREPVAYGTVILD